MRRYNSTHSYMSMSMTLNIQLLLVVFKQIWFQLELSTRARQVLRGDLLPQGRLVPASVCDCDHGQDAVNGGHHMHACMFPLLWTASTTCMHEHETCAHTCGASPSSPEEVRVHALWPKESLNWLRVCPSGKTQTHVARRQ